ncbi:MAG: tRNA (adenosine(37)-N6)-threonylcarbamoyltransferase complex dimerization subunit type 1 TsaB [Smithella sp.]
MLTLAFDTSFKTAAVAILDDETVLYDVLINSGLNHSETLLVAMDQAFKQLRLNINDIDLFACALGPGSFTGLRVGISTLKGILLACAKPAVGVSSLAAVALNITDNNALIYSIMDASRGQVYTASYRYNNNLLLQVSPEKVVEPDEIVFDSACGNIILVGGGAIKYREIFRQKVEIAQIAPAREQFIHASAVGILGREKFLRKELLDPVAFTPVYLRAADAKPGKRLFET